MLVNNDFFSSVLRLGGGTALGQALVLIVTPVITRLYTPSELGLFGIFVAFVGFVGVGLGLRYEMAIVSARDEREADYLLTASLLFAMPTSIVAGMLMLAMIRYNILSYGTLPSWSAVAMVVTLMVTGAFTSLRFWFVRRSDFTSISRALIKQGAGRATVSVALGLMQGGWLGLLLGEIAGRILGISQMMRCAWPAIKKSINTSNQLYFTHTLKINWKFPALVLPSSMVDALASMLPLPFVSYLFGASAAGQFLLVDRLINLPAAFISGSVADVFHGHLSETFRDTPSKVKPTLWGVAKKLGLGAILVYIPIAIVSPFVFGVIFGKEWIQAGFLMSVFSPVGLVGMVVSPVSRLLLVVDRSELKLIVDSFRILVPIVAIFGMHSFGYSFWACMITFSFLQLFSYVIYFGFIWFASDSVGVLSIER